MRTKKKRDKREKTKHFQHLLFHVPCNANAQICNHFSTIPFHCLRLYYGICYVFRQSFVRTFKLNLKLIFVVTMAVVANAIFVLNLKKKKQKILCTFQRLNVLLNFSFMFIRQRIYSLFTYTCFAYKLRKTVSYGYTQHSAHFYLRSKKSKCFPFWIDLFFDKIMESIEKFL